MEFSLDRLRILDIVKQHIAEKYDIGYVVFELLEIDEIGHRHNIQIKLKIEDDDVIDKELNCKQCRLKNKTLNNDKKLYPRCKNIT